MFDQILEVEAVCPAVAADEDWFDPPWLEQVPEPEDLGQIPAAACAPSGWLALELDHATVEAGRLSDADLIDTIVGFDRVSSWALARQARLLAEFARRRPATPCPPPRSEVPGRYSGYAPDEIALALRLSRTAAANRLVAAQVLRADLPATLAAFEAGTLDVLKVRAIVEAASLVAPGQRAALEARVLPRAAEQTVARLRAAVARAVLAIDPEGAQARLCRRRAERRVVVSPEEDGMASLWALLSAPDATAAYQRLCDLARGLGAEDPRGMDARRADLLVDLLTGRHTASVEQPPNQPADPLADQHRVESDDDRATSADPTPADPAPGEPAAADPVRADPARADPARADLAPVRADAALTDTKSAASARTGACDGHNGAVRPGKPLVSVIVPITMLLGLDDHPGELVGYGPIPAPLAREIATEGTWRRLLTDPTSGALLDYGRTTYTPPKGLADYVRARDLYCRNPICGQPAATADLDHTTPWPHGTTHHHNLHATCRHHHRLKTHTPGWHTTQHPNNTVTWTTPTGHTYTSHPHDYRTDPLHGSDSQSGNSPPLVGGQQSGCDPSFGVGQHSGCDLPAGPDPPLF
jgi:hypothetical protein